MDGSHLTTEHSLYDQYRCTIQGGFANPHPFFAQPVQHHPQALGPTTEFPWATKSFKGLTKDMERTSRNQPAAKFTLKRMTGGGTDSKGDASLNTSLANSPMSLRPVGSPVLSSMGSPGSFSRAASVLGNHSSVLPTQSLHPPASKFDHSIIIRKDYGAATGST
ncbi:hypothetical protein IWQ62_002372 [Dispira parvispora]|uniref:Uncharacterized protein n=1 Tax=Dispira parvispora TaxID=1520584 RepID=A0A9W8ASX2_9FUNG|nr:hypothetical protein IWQ62_002372 [Dispira parvispora]